jgi:sn-glycerol 3-phosphate transport system substrate-binding protein
MSLFAATMLSASPASAATEIQWWHAFTRRLGKLLQEQVDKFNASQSECKVVTTHKGNYSEALGAETLIHLRLPTGEQLTARQGMKLV